MSEHARLRELLPLYALGALEGTEECDLVCSHLATGCPECACELADHARVAAHLPDVLAPIAPRPALRVSLERTLGATQKNPVVPMHTPVTKREEPARPSWAWVALPAAAAAAALIAAVNLNEQLRWERNRHWEDAKEITDLSVEMSALHKEIAKNEALANALATGDAQVIALGPAAAGQTGTGHVIWNKKERTWTLLASGMKPLDASQVYELWFIKNGSDPRSAVRFEPSANGIVRQTIPVPADMPQIDLAAVTLEPRKDTDPKPSGTLVIVGKTG